MSGQDEPQSLPQAEQDQPSLVVNRRHRGQRIFTDMPGIISTSNDFGNVSMLPTPLLTRTASDRFDDSVFPVASLSPITSPTTVFPPFTGTPEPARLPSGSSTSSTASSVSKPNLTLIRPSSPRTYSASLVPNASGISSPISPTDSTTSNESIPLHVAHNSAADSILIPKRGELRLTRSGSMGTRRQPSTILHRELAVPMSVSSIRRVGSIKEDHQGGHKQSVTPYDATQAPLNDTEVYDNLAGQEYDARDLNGVLHTWKRIRFLGKGSFSEVILVAKADNPLIKAAVKTILVSGGDAQRQSLARDAELLKGLPFNPTLMHMLGYSFSPTRATFILPYCPGGDLFDLVAKNRSQLSSALVRRIFADACTAVAFLHNHNVVHRDIKLENVLLNVPVQNLLSLENPNQYPYPVAVLTDLGLARRIDPEDPMLTTRCGSEDYVPPEIILGQPYDGRQTDAWALGVLLYAVIEGRLPFDPPPGRSESAGTASRLRLRAAHRIARVDWTWYRRRECTQDWEGGKQLVESVLKRRQNRATTESLLESTWLKHARPMSVEMY